MAAQFTKPLHRPDIVLVAQGMEEPFPKRLLPSALPRARLELSSFALQPDETCLLQELEPAVGAKFAQGRTAMALEFGRKFRSRIGAQSQGQFGER